VAAVGRVVLDRFFLGDARTFALHGQAHVSHRGLSRHPELRLSPASLWRAVGVHEQLRTLPDDVAHALPVSQHYRLLALPESEAKRRLAREALEQRWSGARLSAEIQRARDAREGDVAAGAARTARAGRPPVSDGLKLARRLRHTAEALRDCPDEGLQAMLPAEREQAVVAIDAAAQAIAVSRSRLAALEPGSCPGVPDSTSTSPS
jgi:hypothetical protein